jgi:AraC-like DNA-binding protein
MKLHSLPLLLTFLLFISCNLITELQNTSSQYSPSNNRKKIILEKLEILDTSFSVGYPDEKDINWKAIKFPIIHRMPVPYLGNISSSWLRGEFKINEFKNYKSSDCYAINLNWIGPIVETVYINKQFIDEFDAEEELLKWFSPRSYILPANITLKEKNEVYIRISTFLKYITFFSDISIQNKSSYLYCQKWNNFFYSQLPMGFPILCIGLFIILLWNFLHYKNKRYLLYAFYTFYICIIAFLIYFPANFLLGGLRGTLNFAQLPVQGLLLPVLIFQSIYGIYFTKQNITISIIVLLVIIYYYTTPFYLAAYVSPNFIVLPFYLYYIYLIYSLNKHKPDKFKFTVILSLFILKALFDIFYVFAITVNFGHVIFMYLVTTPIYAVFIIIYEAREAKQKKIEVERMYRILEKKNSNNILTESAEQKIEKIISFLKGNYTSSISREGLASAIDMSPNYMSTLFNKHTGKKISEYLTHLRITDAAEHLKDSREKNMMDIAITVGFESLPAFDRSFKKIIGVTPREYRKKFNI